MSQLEYRAEIDGLRAIAVLSVLLFHAGVPYFGGGFVGVDVFFVISGFLITQILLNDIEASQFSIALFYERRAKRLLPALFVMLMLTSAAAYLVLLPFAFVDYLQSVASTSLFFSNFLFWRQSGYFGTAGEESPLLHTWSLSVEEQFYLLFPLVLLFLYRYGRRPTWLALGILWTLSFALCLVMLKISPIANFYFSPTRGWELLTGSFAALYVRQYGLLRGPSLAGAGTGLIVAAILLFSAETPFPSGWTLLPVLGTAMICVSNVEGSWVGGVLRSSGFVFIGLISYSLYLWHQPVFALARVSDLDTTSISMTASLLVLSTLLAILSWRYVERPFRRASLLKTKTTLFLSLGLIALFAFSSWFAVSKQEFLEASWLSKQDESSATAYRLLSDVKRDYRSGSDEKPCVFRLREVSGNDRLRVDECFKIHGSGVLLVGDSHAWDLAGLVDSRFEKPFIVTAGKGGCRPAGAASNCHYGPILRLISDSPELFRKVIFHQSGVYLLLTEDGTAASRKEFVEHPMTDSMQEFMPNTEAIAQTIDYLAKISQHIPVTWLLPRIEPHFPLREVVKMGCDGPFALRNLQAEAFKKLDDAIATATSEAQIPNMNLVNFSSTINLDLSQDYMTCDALFWSDGDHFSLEGEIRFGKRLPDTFLE